MTKKGFTLMELLVSIFITGMVMLSLVAMWKTSSNQTAQAQRQSIIKNENTIFLRKIYSDFVSASEIICPWGYSKGGVACTSNANEEYYLAVKEAVVKQGNSGRLIRTTNPVCGAGHNSWASADTLDAMAARCLKPTYVVYVFDKSNHFVYRCSDNFLTGTNDTEVSLASLKGTAEAYCSSDAGNREIVMPYVSDFSLSIPSTAVSGHTVVYPELLVEYTVNRDFGEGIPPFIYKFKRYLTKKRGA